MKKKDSHTQKLLKQNRPYDEEEVALEMSEDKRLNRLGIDPDADPVDIMEQLRKKQEELNNQTLEKNKTNP